MTNMCDLTGQVALVTGASRGIGRAIAECLGRQGATVIGTATTSVGAEHITAYLASIGKNTGKGVVLDVCDPLASAALVEDIQKEYALLSILINNAGITQDQLALRMKEEDWSRVIDTNLTAVGRLSRLVLRGMFKAKYGRIVNITSVVGSMGNAGQMNYAAAKAGVAGMSRALAREVGSRHITVNCIAPGFIDTDMTRALNETQSDALLQQIPVGRLGHASEIASAVAFLASREASYITGVTLHVNGGMYLS